MIHTNDINVIAIWGGNHEVMNEIKKIKKVCLILKLKGLIWDFDLDINLQKNIEMHPNWMPQEIALTFIHMYSNINNTPAQVKQHLKYFETKQNKVDKKVMLINDIDNALKI